VYPPSDDLAPYHDYQSQFRNILALSNFEPIPVLSLGIFDAPTVYVCVNSSWASIIIQRLQILTDERAWAGTGEERRIAANEVKRILEAMSCEDCSEFVTDIRVSPTGKLQKKVAGAWVDADGDGGDTTVINNQENIAEETYPPQPTDAAIPASVRACNIASGLSEFLFDKMNDALDLGEAAADIFAASDVILGIVPPLYFIADSVTDLANEFIEAGINAIRASDTTGQREDTLCAIYCFLIDTGEVNSSNINQLREAIDDSFSGNTESLAWQLYMLAYTDAGLIHRAMLYQDVGSAVNCALLCVDCGVAGCDVYFDGNPFWQITKGSLSNDGCDGYQGVQNGGSGELEIIFTAPDTKTFNHFEFFGTSAPSAGKTSYAKVYQDETFVGDIFTFSGAPGAANCFHNSFDFSLTGNRIVLYEDSDSSTRFDKIQVCWQ